MSEISPANSFTAPETVGGVANPSEHFELATPRPIPRPTGFYRNVGKRLFDFTVSLLLLTLFLPLIGILALLISRDKGSPIFSHRRVGQYGREFHCHKLRTMVIDSKERLEHLLATDAEARREWERDRKLTNDPRVTRFGRFLRKSSLDELPQLFNVLKGEMSLVGPRPVPADELALYGFAARDYSNVKPGVTGLWQVSGRNDTSYDERVAMDVSYSQDHNFLLDMRILFRTAEEVLTLGGK